MIEIYLYRMPLLSISKQCIFFLVFIAGDSQFSGMRPPPDNSSLREESWGSVWALITPTLRQPIRSSALNSSIMTAEFFSKTQGSEISGGEFIATPGHSTKYFSDSRNLKITGGRYSTFDRTDTTQTSITTSPTRSSTLSQDKSDGDSHPVRQAKGKTKADQQGA